VVADVTAIDPTSITYLELYANGGTRPTNSSSVSAPSGVIVNKEVTIPLNTTNGKFEVYNSAGTTNITVDVEGYFTGSSNNLLTSVQPQRICDTRSSNPSSLTGDYAQCNGGSGNPGETMSAGGTLTVQAAGLPDVPSTATAVVVNLTALNETSAGYLTVYPSGASLPTASQMNHPASTLDNNEVTVAIGSSGDIKVYNSAGSTDVLIDVLGYFTTQSSPPATTFTYNGDGLRMSSTVSSVTSDYTYDLSSATPAVLTDGTWYYIYGPTGPGGQQLPIEQINVSTGAVYYLHHDIDGSTVVITNTSGDTVNSLSYDPYGNLNGETGTVTSPIGFDGDYQDASTGLDYLVNRYYDPATAQFITQDPIVAVTGEPYQYANDDPLNGSDPSGLCGCAASANAGTIAIASTVTVGYVALGLLFGLGLGLTVAAPFLILTDLTFASALSASLAVGAGTGIINGMSAENSLCSGKSLPEPLSP
jgi:RHS repeat-associated protein